MEFRPHRALIAQVFPQSDKNAINQESITVNNLKYKKGVLRLLFYSLRTNCRQISAISDMTLNARVSIIQNDGLLLSNIKEYPIIPQTMTTINSI